MLYVKTTVLLESGRKIRLENIENVLGRLRCHIFLRKIPLKLLASRRMLPLHINDIFFHVMYV